MSCKPEEAGHYPASSSESPNRLSLTTGSVAFGIGKQDEIELEICQVQFKLGREQDWEKHFPALTDNGNQNSEESIVTQGG